MQVLLCVAGSEFPAAGLTGERGCFLNLQGSEKNKMNIKFAQATP
jgi:hypothetical protein